jgi:hypothetical protein
MQLEGFQVRGEAWDIMWGKLEGKSSSKRKHSLVVNMHEESCSKNSEGVPVHTEACHDVIWWS